MGTGRVLRLQIVQTQGQGEIYSHVLVLMFVDCLEVVDVVDFLGGFTQ